MNLYDPISKIMTTELITVSPNDPLSDVIAIFEREGIHHLPVIQQGELVGIVSSVDILGYTRSFYMEGEQSDAHLPQEESAVVSDIMTTKLAKMEPTDRIEVALEVFKENKFHSILITEGQKLKGIVTTFDIINVLAKHGSAETSYN